MALLTRRRALRVGGLTLSAALAGCTSTLDTETESSPDSNTVTQPEFDTPPPGECEAVEPPTSGPTEGGLEPISYPAYPDEITAETSRAFARDYEHTYRHNAFVQRYEDSWYDELDVTVRTADVVDERHGGYIVEVDGVTVHGPSEPPGTATPTPSPRPAGRLPFTTWYYLTDRYALRYANPHVDEPNFEYGETVVCTE